MNVVRWRFQDLETDEEYVVEINPNRASSHRTTREFAFAFGGTRAHAVQGRSGPTDWTFSGVVRSQSHHDALIDWQRRPGKIRITDHLGRAFEVMLRSVEMTDRRPAGDNTWRFEYQFNSLLLRRVA